MNRRLSVRLLLILLFHARIAKCVPFFLRLGASDEECFQIRSSERRLLQGTFELVASQHDESSISESNDRSLNVLILDYQDKALFESKSVAKDSFRVELASTEHAYWICFQNVAVDEQLPPQTVKVSYQLRPIAYQEAPVFVETSPFAEEWMQLAGGVSQGMEKLQDFYAYIKTREAQHRAVHEDTFSYIVAWSLAELLLVLAVVRMNGMTALTGSPSNHSLDTHTFYPLGP